MENGTPVANWYPDPGDPYQERWWDGNGWTGHTRPRIPTTPPAFTCDQQLPRRIAVGALVGLALVTLGSVAGFWGSISAAACGVIYWALQVFWIPEQRERKASITQRPAAVHESALWWGQGEIWDANLLNPTHTITRRTTRQKGWIAIYRGHLVLHTMTGTVAVTPATTIVAYKTTNSIWLHTTTIDPHGSGSGQQCSWRLKRSTSDHGLLAALSQAGF